jgi:hypothetical protein
MTVPRMRYLINDMQFENRVGNKGSIFSSRQTSPQNHRIFEISMVCIYWCLLAVSGADISSRNKGGFSGFSTKSFAL